MFNSKKSLELEGRDLVVAAALYLLALVLFAAFVAGRPDLDAWTKWLAGTFVGFFLLPCVALTLPSVAEASVNVFAETWRLPVLVLLFPAGHAFYAATVGPIPASEVLTGFLLVETVAVLALWARQQPARLTWADLMLVVLLWVPLAGWWLPDLTFPPGVGSLHYDRFVAIVLALVVFLAVRQVPEIGFHFRWRARDAVLALGVALLYLLPFAFPIGTRAGLLSYSVRLRPVPEILGIVLVIAFLDALPKEFLFRGVFQNLLSRRLGSHRFVAITLSSIVYALAHAGERTAAATAVSFGPLGVAHLPLAYMVLTALAGWFYGLVYDATRKVTVAMFAHTLVDVVWLFFAVPVAE